MKDYDLPLCEGTFYHIYNRGNNRENIFYSLRNYAYFLKKYDEYLSPYLDTYAYCLIANHFHFLSRVKEKESIDSIALSDGINISKTISEQFRRFFIGYSQAINKQEGRRGSLFQKNFKRVPVISQNHLLYLVYYIHANPQRHGVVKDFSRYPYSSYQRFFLDQKTKLRKEEVIEWFGSLDEFAQFHRELQELREIEYLMIED